MALNPVQNYLKNVGKSVVFTAAKFVEENVPVIKEFKENNAELYEEVKFAATHMRVVFKKSEKLIKESEIYKDATTAYANSMKAIKTGKFYDPDAGEAAFNKAMGLDDLDAGFSDMDLDLNFKEDTSLDDAVNGTGDSSDDDVTLSDGDKGIMNAVQASGRMTGAAVASAIDASTKYSTAVATNNTNILYMASIQNTDALKTGFNSLHDTTSQILEFNKQIVATLAENAKTYFETTTKIFQENNAIFKEMIEMQRNMYQTESGAYERREPSRALSELISNGLNLKEYFKQVKSNFVDTVNDKLMLDMLNMPGVKDAFLANPLSIIPSTLLSFAMSPRLKVSLKHFNDTAKGMFPTFMQKMLQKKDDIFGSTLGNILGSIFGVSNDIQKNVKTGVENKVIQFDLETKRSITEVIPSYLARIESILSGKPARVFDMTEGKWTDMKSIRDDVKNYHQYAVRDAFSGEEDEIQSMLGSIRNRKIRRDVDKIYEKVNKKRFKEYGVFDDNADLDELIYKYDLDKFDRRTVGVFLNMMKKRSRKSKMDESANKINAVADLSDKLARIESKGVSPERLLFNGFDPENYMSDIYRDKSRPTTSPASILGRTGVNISLLNTKDKTNKSIFNYLHDIFQRLDLGIKVFPAFRFNTSSTSSEQKKDKKKKKRKKRVINPPSITPLGPTNILTSSQANNIKEYKKYKKYYTDEDKAQDEKELTREDIEQAISDSNEGADYYYKYKYNREIEDQKGFVQSTIDDFVKDRTRKYKSDSAYAQKTFMQKLLTASSVGDRFAVILQGLQDLTAAPADILANVVESADKMMYKFFFADEEDQKVDPVTGKKIKGFFGRLTAGLEEQFTKVDNFFKYTILGTDKDGNTHLMDNIKRWTGGAIDLEAMKDRIVAPAITGVKAGFKAAYGSTKKSVTDTYDDIIGYADGSYNVKKSGLVVLSKGERVIPADENIYNPDRDKANREKDRLNESRIKQRFLDLLKAGNTNPDIQSFAKGTKKKGYNPNKSQKKNEKSDPVKKLAAKVEPNNIEKSESVVKLSLGTLLGVDPRKVDNKIKQTMTDVENHIPEAAKLGTIGGLTSGLFLGTPLLGAVLGSAYSVASKSEMFQNFVFGKEVEKSDGTKERKGGLISKKYRDMFAKYMPDVKKYGIAGGVAGLITPFGPLGGAVLGSAIALAKNNKTVNNMLFGKYGFISDETKKMAMKTFPAASKGAIAGAMAGAFTGLGAFPGAIVGAGIGLISTTDSFKDVLLGEIDPKTGKRKGGLVGELRKGFIEPLKKVGNELSSDIGNYFRENFFEPITSAIAPIGKLLEIGLKTTGKYVNKSIRNFVKNKLLKSGVSLSSRILSSMGKFGKGVLTASKYGAKAVGFTTSLVPRMTGYLGDKAREFEIKHGYADFMDAESRLKAMGEKDYDLRSFDEKLAGSSRDELQELQDNLNTLKEGKGFLEKRVDEHKTKLAKEVTKLVDNDGGRANKIMNYLLDGNNTKAMQEIRKSGVSASKQKRLINLLQKDGNKLLEYKKKSENYENTRKEAMKSLSKQGLTNINDDNIDKFSSLIKTQLDYNKPDLELTPEEKAAEANSEIISNSLDDNFKETNAILSDILKVLITSQKKGGKLTNAEEKELKSGKASLDIAANRSKSIIKEHYTKGSDLVKKYGVKLSESNKRELGNNPKLYGRVAKLLKQGYHIEALNDLINASPKIQDRYFKMASKGYHVEDLDALGNMSNTQFRKYLKAAKMTNGALPNINGLAYENNKELSIHMRIKNRFPELNDDQVKYLAEKFGARILRKKESKKVAELIKNGKLDLSHANSEKPIVEGNRKLSNGFSLKGTDVHSAIDSKISKAIENTQEEILNAAESGIKSKFGNIKQGYNKAKLGFQQGIQKAINYIGDKATNGKTIKIGKHADGVSKPLLQPELAVVSKGERIESKQGNVVNTPYGPLTYKQDRGSLELENTKSNQEIERKVKASEEQKLSMYKNIQELTDIKKKEYALETTKKTVKKGFGFLKGLFGILATVLGPMAAKLLTKIPFMKDILKHFKLGRNILDKAQEGMFSGAKKVAKKGAEKLFDTKLGKKFGDTKFGQFTKKVLGVGQEVNGVTVDISGEATPIVEAIKQHDDHMAQILSIFDKSKKIKLSKPEDKATDAKKSVANRIKDKIKEKFGKKDNKGKDDSTEENKATIPSEVKNEEEEESKEANPSEVKDKKEENKAVIPSEVKNEEEENNDSNDIVKDLAKKGGQKFLDNTKLGRRISNSKVGRIGKKVFEFLNDGEEEGEEEKPKELGVEPPSEDDPFASIVMAIKQHDDHMAQVLGGATNPADQARQEIKDKLEEKTSEEENKKPKEEETSRTSSVSSHEENKERLGGTESHTTEHSSSPTRSESNNTIRNRPGETPHPSDPKVKGFKSRIINGFKAVKEKIGKFIGKQGCEGLSKLCSTVVERIDKPAIKEKLTKYFAKAAAAVGSTIASGGIMGVVLAVSDAAMIVESFYSGFNDASSILNAAVSACTIPMKLLAGAINAVWEQLPLSIILSTAEFTTMAIDILGPAFGVSKSSINQANKAAEAGEKQANVEANKTTKELKAAHEAMSLGGAASKAWAAIKGFGSSAWNTIKGVGTSLWNGAKNLASSAWNGAKNLASSAWQTAKNIGTTISDGASTAYNKAKQVASDTIGALKKYGSEGLKYITGGGGKYGRGLTPSYGTGIKGTDAFDSFHSQLDPVNAMQMNVSGDTEFQDMADSGCGPVSAANAASAFGIPMDSKMAANYALKNGYKEKDGGTKPGFFKSYLSKAGISTKRVTNSEDIMSNLKQGNPVILMGRDKNGTSNRNPYGRGYHYVTATGVDGKGNMIIQDPETKTPNLKYNANQVLSKSSVAIATARGKNKFGKGKSNIPSPLKKYKYGRGATDIPEYIWNFLKSKGLGSVQIAAIMGNIAVESGGYDLNAKSQDGANSYGLCQWTAGRKTRLLNYCSNNNLDPASVEGQMNYFWWEASNKYPKALKDIMAQNDIEKATEIWCDEFEAPSIPHMDRRIANAKEAFDKQGKGIKFVGSYSGGSGSSQDQNQGGGILGSLARISNKIGSSMLNALLPLGTGMASAASSMYGDSITEIFGSNVFNPFQSAPSSSGGTAGGGEDFSGKCTSPQLQAAVKWAQSREGSQGYGDNGCTAFVRDFLLQAGNPVGTLMQNGSQGNLMWVPTLVSWAKSHNLWKDASQGGNIGDIVVTLNCGHVTICDGEGGCWGNSSSKNQIIHYKSTSAAFGTPDGYVATGDQSTQATVSTGDSTRTKAQMEADAGSSNSGQGKYGRGKEGNGGVKNLNDAPPSQVRLSKPSDIYRAKATKSAKYGRGNFVDKIQAIIKSNSRDKYADLLDQQNKLKTVSDIKKYISGVPASFISKENKIDYQNDTLDVARAKAVKIKQNYDAYLRKSGKQTTKVKALDPNKIAKAVNKPTSVVKSDTKQATKVSTQSGSNNNHVTINNSGVSDAKIDTIIALLTTIANALTGNIDTKSKQTQTPSKPAPSSSSPAFDLEGLGSIVQIMNQLAAR